MSKMNCLSRSATIRNRTSAIKNARLMTIISRAMRRNAKVFRVTAALLGKLVKTVVPKRDLDFLLFPDKGKDGIFSVTYEHRAAFSISVGATAT